MGYPDTVAIELAVICWLIDSICSLMIERVMRVVCTEVKPEASCQLYTKKPEMIISGIGLCSLHMVYVASGVLHITCLTPVHLCRDNEPNDLWLVNPHGSIFERINGIESYRLTAHLGTGKKGKKGAEE